MTHLQFAVKPNDVLTVLLVPYDFNNKTIFDAYENVAYVAYNLSKLGWKAGDHIRKYIANQHHRTILYDDVNYEIVQSGLINLLDTSLPFDTDFQKYIRKTPTKKRMIELGVTDYESYINALGIDELLRRKVEAEKRFRDDLAERISKHNEESGSEIKTSNSRPRKYKMSDKPRKQRSDKGKKRDHYIRKAMS